MAENSRPDRSSSPDDWEELLRYYRELETVIGDPDSDSETIILLIDRCEKLVGRLKMLHPAENDCKTKIEEACQRLNQLMPRIRQEKEKALHQLSTLKTGRAAMSAYQRPRLGMGFTEGKFLDNKK
jgi:hypothetical protein